MSLEGRPRDPYETKHWDWAARRMVELALQKEPSPRLVDAFARTRMWEAAAFAKIPRVPPSNGAYDSYYLTDALATFIDECFEEKGNPLKLPDSVERVLVNKSIRLSKGFTRRDSILFILRNMIPESRWNLK